jgi:hypothetical protein
MLLLVTPLLHIRPLMPLILQTLQGLTFFQQLSEIYVLKDWMQHFPQLQWAFLKDLTVIEPILEWSSLI